MILIGAPGSGKGTQSRYLIDKHNFIQLSTGDLLRKAIAEKNSVGLMAKSLMDNGKFVPDEIMISLVENYINDNKGKSIIFDGFPRTVTQAKNLESALEKNSTKIDKVIYFSINPELIVKRLTGRRTCEKCGEIYHIDSKPSLNGEECEKCGGKIVQRPDDRKEVIGERLEQFRKNTGPTIDYYIQKSMLVEVDCEKDSKLILLNIEKILGLSN
ncbi:MAG: adenylate kinase [Pseudobdellovibrio sp.]